MQLALASPEGSVHMPDEARIAEGINASRASPRGRMIVPIQRSESAMVQRLLNVMQPGSYVRPHLHPRPQAVETICVLQGRLAAFLFASDGTVERTAILRPGPATGILDIEPGVWHTFAALEPDTIALEIKGGPYDRSLDKVWAPWSPEEADPSAPAFLASLLAAAS